MTTTMFHSPRPDCHMALLEQDCLACEALCSSNVNAIEAQRMKAFAGQRRFQAPVADDFSKGMLAVGQSADENANSQKHTGLLGGLSAWWRRQKLG